MKKHPKAKYPEINYAFRPDSYWRETDPLGLILRNVKGENRREIIRRYFAEGRLEELDQNILRDELDDKTRMALAALHPTFLGGEFLPEYDDNEVEIARIALQSTTADVISVRASAAPGGIEYSVVDEYDGVFFLPFTKSKEPLPLAELIRLLDDGYMEDCPYPGGLSQCNNIANAEGGYTGLRHFTTISSDFYPQLYDHYEQVFAAWFAAGIAEEETRRRSQAAKRASS